MAIPDFDTTLSLFRAWAKRGARMDEIAAAISLQQGSSSSSGGGATPAQIEQAVANALAADPVLTDLPQKFDDSLIEQSNTTDAVNALQVANQSDSEPIDLLLNDGDTLPLKLNEPDCWITGYDLIFSESCLATLLLDGNKKAHLFDIKAVEKNLPYGKWLAGDFEILVREAPTQVRVTGAIHLRRIAL